MSTFAAAASCAPKPDNINSFQAFVSSKYPSFNEMKVEVPRFSLTFQPWKDWSQSAPPEWWTYGYNKIKHDRLGYPGAPSMHRAIQSVGALLVLLLHLYTFIHGEQCMMPFELAPSLFVPCSPNGNEGGASFSWSWELPRAL